MASIQPTLFTWQQIDSLGDLERLVLVLKYLHDEELMRYLEGRRGCGRNDYPVRPMWNSILAGVIFQHPSIESLRRELSRNAQLRALCGFDSVNGPIAIPPSWVYTRFLKRLFECREIIEGIFDRLVTELKELLPGFGKHLAVDSKGIRSLARRKSKKDTPDGRRDLDANTGVKTYRGEREDGSAWEKVKSWFGYKIHLVVDSTYELPVAFEVTRASRNDQPVAHDLLTRMEERHPGILDGCDTLTADKAYDGAPLLERLWDDYRIKGVIDIKNCWQDDEYSRLVDGYRNVTYTYDGMVECFCLKSGEKREMVYRGFEADRETLKYRCPALCTGEPCEGMSRCPVKKDIRVKLSTDRRIFTPIARTSLRWKREYKKRTSVERVNSRLDVSFGFEQHFIRGMEKMDFRCGLALIVMLAMAVGRIRENQKEKMRSLVRAA